MQTKSCSYMHTVLLYILHTFLCGSEWNYSTAAVEGCLSPLSCLLIYNIQASFAVIRRWKISWSNQPVITIQHWPRFTWQVVSEWAREDGQGTGPGRGRMRKISAENEEMEKTSGTGAVEKTWGLFTQCVLQVQPTAHPTPTTTAL